MFDSIVRSVPTAQTLFPSGCDTKAARPYIWYGHGTRNARSASYGSRKACPGLGPYIPRSGAPHLQLLPLSIGSGAGCRRPHVAGSRDCATDRRGARQRDVQRVPDDAAGRGVHRSRERRFGACDSRIDRPAIGTASRFGRRHSLLCWIPAMSIRRTDARLRSRTREFSDEPRAASEHRIEPALERP